jgi:type IV pilus assembly protein PilV
MKIHLPSSAKLPGYRRGARGVTMLEVLVAMVIVALGALAVIAIQLTSKRSNLESTQRTMATQLGYGFLERIRANNSAEALAAYLAAGANGFGNGRQSAPGKNCTTALCSEVELAQYDAWLFEQELDGAAELVGTTKTGGLAMPLACLSAVPPGGISAEYTLTVVWKGTGAYPSNPNIDCGKGLVIGGRPAYGTNDEFRRSLVLNAYVAVK